MVRLVNWGDLEGRTFPNLLIGNGFSQCFSENFNYRTLKQYGVTNGFINTGLDSVFSNFNTVNFEEVLDRLSTTETVLTSLGQNATVTGNITRHHQEMKDALIQIVNAVHPDHNQLTTRLSNLNDHLRAYSSIFSTNYDLLIYWSLMFNENAFKDFFWNRLLTFDYSDTEARADAQGAHPTLVYYLHGALHLFRNNHNEITKATATAGRSLLEEVDDRIGNSELPLFISEGDTEHKISRIRSSDYLLFCLNSFRNLQGNLLVFGHSLSPQFDGHLLKAIKKNFDRLGENFEVAISIYGNDIQAARDIDHHLVRNVSTNLRRSYFHSETHPIAQI